MNGGMTCRTVRCKKEAAKCLCFSAAMQMLSVATDPKCCSLSILDFCVHLVCIEVLGLCVCTSLVFTFVGVSSRVKGSCIHLEMSVQVG